MPSEVRDIAWGMYYAHRRTVKITRGGSLDIDFREGKGRDINEPFI